MTDEQQIQGTPEGENQPTGFEEWVMKNRLVISLVTIFLLTYISKYMGWLH